MQRYLIMIKDSIFASTIFLLYLAQLVDTNKMFNDYKSLAELQKHFCDQEMCTAFIRQLRWPDGVISPYNGSTDVRQLDYYGTYQCRQTGKRFSLLTGTIFSKSKIPLPTWFQVIYLHASAPLMNSAEIARELSLNQKTVWSMIGKIDLATGA